MPGHWGCARCDRAPSATAHHCACTQVLADISLDYELTLGNCLEIIRWDHEGKAVTISATNGYMWSYDIANK